MINILRLFSGLLNHSKTRTVLVVDDSEVDLRFASRVLEKHYIVLQARNGQEALAMAREKKPDVIVMDYMMPDIVGPQVCQTLKADDQTKDIPVIILTGADTPSNVISCFEKEVDIYLAKPVTAYSLIKQVRLTIEAAELTKKRET